MDQISWSVLTKILKSELITGSVLTRPLHGVLLLEYNTRIMGVYVVDYWHYMSTFCLGENMPTNDDYYYREQLTTGGGDTATSAPTPSTTTSTTIRVSRPGLRSTTVIEEDVPMETVAPADDPEPEIIRVSDLHCMYMYVCFCCADVSTIYTL